MTKRDIPWQQIKEDYMTGIGMRELARRYGLSVSTVSEHAKKYEWRACAEQISQETERAVKEVVVKRSADNADRAMRILDKLMNKMEQAVDSVNKKDVTAMKSLVASMKDLRELGVYEVKRQDKNVEIKLSDEVETYGD